MVIRLIINISLKLLSFFITFIKLKVNINKRNKINGIVSSSPKKLTEPTIISLFSE